MATDDIDPELQRLHGTIARLAKARNDLARLEQWFDLHTPPHLAEAVANAQTAITAALTADIATRNAAVAKRHTTTA